MIDIHAHLLPGVDDGSESVDMSLDMLDMAYSSGVRGIVSTNHCNIPGIYDNYAGVDMLDKWKELQTAVKLSGIPIQLYRGMEVFSTEELPDLLTKHRVWALNYTHYFLTEFSFDEDPDFCDSILAECIKRGLKPVIAHPERYYFVQRDPQIAFDWCVNGCALQVNKGSILGRFGRREQETADRLLAHNIVACVASDAHKPYERTTDMNEVRYDLMDRFGVDYTHLVLSENPGRILSDKELVGYEPRPFF